MSEYHELQKMKIEEDRMIMATFKHEKWVEKKFFYMLRDSVVKSKVVLLN